MSKQVIKAPKLLMVTYAENINIKSTAFTHNVVSIKSSIYLKVTYTK